MHTRCEKRKISTHYKCSLVVLLSLVHCCFLGLEEQQVTDMRDLSPFGKALWKSVCQITLLYGWNCNHRQCLHARLIINYATPVIPFISLACTDNLFGFSITSLTEFGYVNEHLYVKGIKELRVSLQPLYIHFPAYINAKINIKESRAGISVFLFFYFIQHIYISV